MKISWVLEEDVFSDRHARLAEAVRSQGYEVISWKDEWWLDAGWPTLSGKKVVFHGSLQNAAKIAKDLPWHPGAYCDVSAFECTAWYDQASRWRVNDRWVGMKAQQFVANGSQVLDRLELDGAFFVRPNSPLKPFSGRVLTLDQLSLEALDFGFYYDDPDIMVIVAPVRRIEQEWRFVAVENSVVAGSAYEAGTRLESESPLDDEGAAWAFASQVASDLPPPEPVWVLDICETDAGLKLLELNPFSGADLYACDRGAIVSAVSGLSA